MLPVLVGPHNKWIRFAKLVAFIWLLNLLSNHLQVFTASTLDLGWLDKNIPFIADTVWIYFSYFAIFFFAYHLESDKEYLNKYFYGLLLLNLLSNLIFIFFPVTYERTHAPLIADAGTLTKLSFELIFFLDPPRNCYPSLHVSIAFFSAFHWMSRNHLRFVAFFSWATLISASTLTTKQHYAVDTLSGFILASGVYYLVFYRLDFSGNHNSPKHTVDLTENGH